MNASNWIVLGIVLLMFLASIWLAAAETAFVRMNRVRAMGLADEGQRGAAKLAKLLERPEATVNGILLLVLVTQLSSAYLLGILLDRQLGAIGIVLGLVIQLVLFFVVGEVVPKTYAILHTDRAALRTAGLLYALTNFLPLRLLSGGLIKLANVVMPGKGLKEGPFVTEADLKTMADVAADEETIENEERELIHSIFEFGDTVVREVMLPRPDMVAIKTDASVEEGINTAIDAGLLAHTRLRRRHRQHRRAGVSQGPRRTGAQRRRRRAGRRFVAARGLRAGAETGGRAAPRDADAKVSHGDRRRRARRHRGARHARRRARRDRRRDHRRVRHRGPATSSGFPVARFRVPGRTPIGDLSELVGVRFPDDEWDTVSGLVFNLLGRVPEGGETVTSEGFDFTVERMEGQRIMSVLVAPHDAQPADAVPDEGASGSSKSGRCPTRRRRSEFGIPFGLRHDRRPTQRRKVDARQSARRSEGRDRVRSAADDPRRHPWRTHDRGEPDRAPRHARDCTGRAHCWGSAPTSWRAPPSRKST